MESITGYFIIKSRHFFQIQHLDSKEYRPNTVKLNNDRIKKRAKNYNYYGNRQPNTPRQGCTNHFFMNKTPTKQREIKNKSMATTLGLLLTTPNPHKKSLQIYSSSLPKHLPTSSLPTHRDTSHDLLQNLHKSISHLTLSTLPTAAALTLPFLLASQVIPMSQFPSTTKFAVVLVLYVMNVNLMFF